MALLSLILPLLPIIYEDFRYRAIHWFWVLALVILMLFFYPINWSLSLLNFSFLVFQLFALSLYFSWKNRRWTNIVDQYIGLGDLVFFLPLCGLFAPFTFLVFFIISLLFSLLSFFLVKKLLLPKMETIPLAGCMAIVLIGFLLLDSFTSFDLNNDYFFLKMLYSRVTYSI